MKINALPHYDMRDNPTNCCPRFNSHGWEGAELHFQDKLFVKANTISLFHIPLNISWVYPKTFKAIEDAGALDKNDMIVLSYDPSPWRGEHYFAVCKDVPGQEMVKLSGDYLTKVFEGPYKNMPQWEEKMKHWVESQGKAVEKTYFFYTTCPKCAKVYGKNYVVAVAKLM